MKKITLFLVIMLLSFGLVKAGDPFFYESISNSDKTINYIFGFYPSQLVKSTASDSKDYTAITAAVINKSTSSLDWSDYYIIILLKDGDLVFSYETAAKSGDYNCTYKVPAGETHYQKFCFHKIFDAEDIKSVWLFDKSTLKPFKLIYDKNKD